MISPVTADDRFDRWAIGLSGLCVVHCLLSAVVLLFAAASAGGGLFDHHIHEAGLMLAIGLGLIGFGRGFLQHGRLRPVAIGGTGLAIMGFALTVPHGTAEIAATLLGVAIVAIGHQFNRRAYR